MSSDKTQNEVWRAIRGKSPPFLLGVAAGAFTVLGFFITRSYFERRSSKSIDSNDSKSLDVAKTSDTDLSRNNVYRKLEYTVKAKNNFYYQVVADPFIPSVLAINLLIEYLPSSIIKTVFLYLPGINDFDIDQHLSVCGWSERENVLHDNANIFVQNVRPIRNQPSLIMTIGLPGSGKSTWAKTRVSKKDMVIAADDYFDKFNDGNFDAKLLQKAHDWAQTKVSNALKAGQSVVANNTNTTLSEMHAYITKAVFSGYPHKIVFAVMPEQNIKVLAKRGLHGVSAKKIKEMLKRMSYWMNKYPPSIEKVLKAGAFKRGRPQGISKDVIYYGIFLNAQTQDKLRKYLIAMSGKPLLCDTTDCHLTLKYQPLEEEVNLLRPIGSCAWCKYDSYGNVL